MSDPQLFLQAMYKEQCDQARQQENLRQTSTTIILGLSGAVIAALAVSAPHILKQDLRIFGLYIPFGLFIVFLARFGRQLSLKHYERNRMHTSLAAAYRERLEGLFPGAGYGKNLHAEAKRNHAEKWRADSSITDKDVINSRLYAAWMDIYLFLTWTGILLIAISSIALLSALLSTKN